MVLGMSAAAVLAVAHATTGPRTADRVAPSGYNAAAQTLTLQGRSGGTYLVDANTLVRSGDQPVPRTELGDAWEVIAIDAVSTPDGSKLLRSIDVAPPPRVIEQSRVRTFLLSLCVIEFAAVLLIVTNASASAVTREKEDGTLELLLTTPITSRYYVWGKLRGLVSYVMPLMAVPVGSCLLFVIVDGWRLLTIPATQFEWTALPESVLLLPPTLVVSAALASLAGMMLSLRMRTTVMAVMASAAVVIGVTLALGWCGATFLLQSNTSAAAVAGSFSPFTLMTMLIAPREFGGEYFSEPARIEPRLTVALATLVATAIAAAGAFGLYKSMVKNFDMTIRRQSR
jgi:ABC-type Na+ efflux pump permease subunit